MIKTQLYMGSFKLLEKSGVGRAILHQKSVLEKQGIEVTDEMERDVDIVHINTVMPNSVYTAIKARLTGKKVVYYAHSTMEDFKNSFRGSNVLAPLFKKWIRFCYNLGDVIITPTEYSKRIIEGYGMKKDIYALSNGIDTEFFAPKNDCKQSFREKYGLSKDDKIVISVGHFIERKGILDYIETAEKMPEITFIWFGHTNLNIIPTHVKAAIDNAPKNLIFAGYVSKEELRDAYCSADLFAFMSHEETEGIVVLEALACEIPTIVRNIPVYEGWLHDGVNIHKADTNQDFFEKINVILHSSTKTIEEKGKEVASDRSIRTVGDRLKIIYSNILSVNTGSEVVEK